MIGKGDWALSPEGDLCIGGRREGHALLLMIPMGVWGLFSSIFAQCEMVALNVLVLITKKWVNIQIMSLR